MLRPKTILFHLVEDDTKAWIASYCAPRLPIVSSIQRLLRILLRICCTRYVFLHNGDCEMFAPKGWNPEIIVHLFETICATSRERRSCLRYPLPTQGETNILSNPPPAPTQMYTHPDGNPTPLPLSAHTRNPHKQELGASEGGIGLLWNVTKSTQWMGEAALYLLNTSQEAGIVTKCTKKHCNTQISYYHKIKRMMCSKLGVAYLCVLTLLFCGFLSKLRWRYSLSVLSAHIFIQHICIFDRFPWKLRSIFLMKVFFQRSGSAVQIHKLVDS